MNKIVLFFIVILLVFLNSLLTFSQTGGSFLIEKSVIAGGGGRSSGGTFSLDATIGQPLAGTSSLGGNFSLLSGFWASGNAVQSLRRSPFDFDGDQKTDISIFRPSDGVWWYQKSSNNQVFAAQFGISSDKLTPADFTGDGKTDIAFF